MTDYMCGGGCSECRTYPTNTQSETLIIGFARPERAGTQRRGEGDGDGGPRADPHHHGEGAGLHPG